MRASFVVVLMLLAVAGCSRPTELPVVAPAAGNDFSPVLARLQAAAKAKSVGGTTITVAPPTVEPDGGRVVTAKRVRPDGTTEYTLRFRPAAGGWVCGGVTAVEKQAAGGTSTNRLEGTGAEWDQLMLWLDW